MTLNAKNLNINVSQNMTTNVGMNASENVSMNKTTSIGLVNLLNVGADFMTNVVGNLLEFIQGNRESESEERKEIAKSVSISSTEDNVKIHASKNISKHSGEKSKIS